MNPEKVDFLKLAQVFNLYFTVSLLLCKWRDTYNLQSIRIVPVRIQ